MNPYAVIIPDPKNDPESSLTVECVGLVTVRATTADKGVALMLFPRDAIALRDALNTLDLED